MDLSDRGPGLQKVTQEMNQNILRTNTCLPLLLLSIIIALLVVVPVHASVLITDCGADLSTPGEYYVIANDITSAGTCLTTGADNIVIDGQGNSIVFAWAFDAEAGEWVWDCGDYFGVAINHNNVTLKNANITGCGSGSVTTAGGVGIFGLDDVVANNTLSVDLQSEYGGVVLVDAWPAAPNVTVISDNNITLRGEYASGNGISTTGGAPINATGNDIYINSDNSGGVHLFDAGGCFADDGIFILGNVIHGYGNNFIGIRVNEYHCPSTFVNNTIFSESSGGFGVYVTGEFGCWDEGEYMSRGLAGRHVFENNIIKMTGLAYAAFYIEWSTDNQISGGSINVDNDDAYSYYMGQGALFNNFYATNFTGPKRILLQNEPLEFSYGDLSSKKAFLVSRFYPPGWSTIYLTRNISVWSQNSMIWNDDATSDYESTIAYYNVTGVAPNADYEVTNSSAAGTFTRYLSSDADGNIPVFDVLLEGNNELNVSCVASCIEPPVADNTPPEAVIGFDSVSKDIVLFNSETGSEVVNDLNGMAESSRMLSSKNDDDYGTKGWELRQYTFTDYAGNSLVLTLEHKKDEGHEVAIRLVSMQYNDGAVIKAAKKNEMKVEYSDARDGSLKELEQKIEVKDAFTVNAKYAAKRNETVIKTKLEGRKERKETKAGLVMLELLTEKGGLSFR